jgi:hypothetical protein
MLDLIYVLGTVGFFTGCIGYVIACERLGRRVENARDT